MRNSRCRAHLDSAISSGLRGMLLHPCEVCSWHQLFGPAAQGAFLNSVAKWVVTNSQRVVIVLHPYRLGHKKPYATHETHPAHA